MRRNLFSAIVVGLLLGSAAFAAPQDQDVFDDFEGFNPNTNVGDPVTIGTSPDAATLSGDAFAGAVGAGVLYHTGIRSWMVVENGTGVIDFETNAAAVEFFIRTHPTADGDTVITAFDDGNGVIGSPITITAGATDPNDPLGRGFFMVSLAGDIDRIEVQNQATNIMNGLDDFGFTPVPEPATAAMFGIVALVALRQPRSRERHV